MTIFNLGSINIDNFYTVEHLPEAGETLASVDHRVGLGGKGANQSVAAARAGSNVKHIGAVGPEGGWCRKALSKAGVDVTHVASLQSATGHANICVDPNGENMIVLYSGANGLMSAPHVEAALGQAAPNDTLILQNETNLTLEAARYAKAKGMFVIYSAAPFEAGATENMLAEIDLLVLNQIEAEQLSSALGARLEDIPVPAVLVTRGADGAAWYDNKTKDVIGMPAFSVTPVDTTGAGDCFIGYVSAGLDQGLHPKEALRLGAAASALQVTRHGTADAMPSRAEVDQFRSKHAQD